MSKLEKFLEKMEGKLSEMEKSANTIIAIGEDGVSQIYIGYKVALHEIREFLQAGKEKK